MDHTAKAPVLQEKFPIAGIGASAGGLAAFEQFFSSIPADAALGMAFVLVQHMAPDYKSMLPEIISRYTRMQVYDVRDGMAVRPDCVYIIPPNRDMVIMDGVLHLIEPAGARGHRLPIDSFFRSLASDQQGRSIAIILSGTGSDGTLGVRAIKAEGGMVMVQSPESSEYNGMPLSAIGTGLADYVLTPGKMPAQLLDYVSRMFEEGFQSSSNNKEAMDKIFNQLLVRTGHDFSQYKQKTIERRIGRRMAVNNIRRIDGYANYLQQRPEETEALFRDLLITVTNFFRNPNVFETLQAQAIQRLFEGKSQGTLIRAWVVGCSTGEEAYSLGILLYEEIEKLKQAYKVQIFATDIDSQTIEHARRGVYPAGISEDVSPERLKRFFIHDPERNTYSIQKNIRDMIIFSEQDVIMDPPFSKLDLISCRNLLIYLNKDTQKKLIPMFHYALNPGGFLLLGSSESVGEFSDIFETVDRHSKLYQQKGGVPDMHRYLIGTFLPSPIEKYVSPRPSGKPFGEDKLQLRELTERKMLQEYAPAGVMVNERGDILYLHGRTSLYLELPPGEPGHNILKMAREGLRQPLTTALRKAVVRKEQAERSGIRVRTNGGFTNVDLKVRPVEEVADISLFLVTFEASEPRQPPCGKDEPANGEEEESISALKEELRTTEDYLKSANEELEISNEELRSSNEEMQSMNEELQSTNEELETSREELQSVNEELSTVNTELQTKVAELSQANDDMNNILACTGIGIVFVDDQLRIQRFTPAATKLINLIPTDVGRPLAHTVTNIAGYSSLIEDVKSVLDSRGRKSIEIRTHACEWYVLGIRPYRTLKNEVEGAVITFTEITQLKEIQEKQANTMRRLAAIVHDSADAITLQDMEGHILAWNPMAEKMYGWSEAEALAMNVSSMVPENRKEETLAALKKLGQAEALEPYRTQRLTKDGRMVDVQLTVTPLVNEAGEVYSIATTERQLR